MINKYHSDKIPILIYKYKKSKLKELDKNKYFFNDKIFDDENIYYISIEYGNTKKANIK